MVVSNWNDIHVGDFFVPSVQMEEAPYLYQKIDSTKAGGYNAILLNTGELCNLYIRPDAVTTFQKVTATFEIQTEIK